MLLDSLFILYVVLIIISVLRKGKSNQDYLSAETSTELRGIAAIGIVFHHLSERTHGGAFFSKLPMVGYLLVTFFFFLSGFGLLVQYKKKGDSYLQGFLKKRVLYLAVIYALDVILYAIVGNLMGQGYTLGVVIKSIFVSGVAKNAWYMIVQILSYVFFFVVFRFYKSDSLDKKILGVFVLQTVFLAFCIVNRISSMWYLSNYGFTLGMLWANHKPEIDRKLADSYPVVFTAVSGLFVLFYAVPVFTDRLLPDVQAETIRLSCRLISSPLSVCALMTIIYKYHPCMRLWSSLGKISLEIYLIHGMVYSVLRSDYIFVNNDFIWSLLTVICSIILAIPMNRFNRKVAQVLR